VLGGILGLSAERLDELDRDGVTGHAPVGSDVHGPVAVEKTP
jgi:hypothetical protein